MDEPVSAQPVTSRKPNDRRKVEADRYAQVQESWPSTRADRDQVSEVLADYDLLGRVMRDVLRIGYDAPRRGQRSPLEWSDGQARLRALSAERAGQATTRPFADAFPELASEAGATIDDIAAGADISRSQVHRLLRGHIMATPIEMAKLATYFGKPVTYFTEYRVHLICESMAQQLVAAPERTIDVLVRMGVHPDTIDA